MAVTPWIESTIESSTSYHATHPSYACSVKNNNNIFTALHGMQTRSCDENSVRLSVRLSVERVDCDKTEKYMFRFLYHTKDNLSEFSEKKNGWWGAIPSTWNLGSTDPRWSEIADFEQIIARSGSAVTPSEKSSINTNRKSTTRFPTRLRWSSRFLNVLANRSTHSFYFSRSVSWFKGSIQSSFTRLLAVEDEAYITIPACFYSLFLTFEIFTFRRY